MISIEINDTNLKKMNSIDFIPKFQSQQVKDIERSDSIVIKEVPTPFDQIHDDLIHD